MEFEEWMSRNNEIANLIINSRSTEEIISKVDINQDFEFLCINGSLDNKKIVSLIEYLLNNGQENIVEQNIDYIPTNMWEKLYNNEKFRTMFLNNTSKALSNKSIIEWNNIKDYIKDERGREFFEDNIDVILESFSSSGFEVGNMVEDLFNKTDYGKRLLIDNQSKLFEGRYDLHQAFIIMYDANIDYSVFLSGVSENIDDILKNDNKLNYLIIQINDMISKSELPKEEIEQMREHILQEVMSQFNGIVDYNSQTPSFINELRKMGIPQEFLSSKQEDILSNLSGQELLIYIKQSMEYEGLDENYDIKKLVNGLYKDNSFVLGDNQTLSVIETLINEISQNQGINPLSIESAGEGRYSKVLKIGDFILKLGDKRQNNEIPYDKRILRPIIRQETNPGSNDGTPNLFIEVQNAVDTKWYEGMTEEQIEEVLYEVYADLRDRNVIWADVKKDNIGKLLKDNRSNYYEDGQEIVGDEDAIMMKGINNEEVLKKGEYVVIDTDFLYNKDKIDEKTYSQAKVSFHKKFEKRYQEEQREKIGGSKVSQGVIDFSEEMKKLANTGTQEIKRYMAEKTREPSIENDDNELE